MRTRVMVAAVVVVLALAALLAPLPPRWGGGWRGTLLDLGHVPLFAALTLGLGFALRRGWVWPAAIALALAAAAELFQPLVGRTASLLDLLRGAAGVAAAVILAHAARWPRTVPRLGGHALALVAVLAWPVADAAPLLLDAWEGHSDFPTLADFATRRQLLRWDVSQARLERVADPEADSGASARLDFLPGPRRYPYAMLLPVVRDWSDKQSLYCSFTVPDAPLLLVVSVRGQTAEGGPTHYQFERTYPPGRHVLEVDLESAARRAQRGLLDLTEVYCVQLFIYREHAPRTIRLHRVWLK
jgi:hypothetical protein